MAASEIYLEEDMMTAMMIAKVFGPYLAILGIWMLLYSDNTSKISSAIKNSIAAQYGMACVNMLLGLFIINSFNMWEMNALFFVTLLGWALFVRGVMGLFMPQLIVTYMLTHKGWSKAMGLVPFVWGLILIWIAYYM